MTETDPARVRDQLDEILAREITAFIEIDSDIARLDYNLATIACIHVTVEREREIKAYPDMPPERYTIESLKDELADIGLERDENLDGAIDSVIKRGYVTADDTGRLKAEVSAYTMVGFLDNMFPGMQGMNLIAFVLQMNDEVLTARKTIGEAKTVFSQTLKSRGVRVTREKAEQKASEIARGQVDTASREVARKLKKDNLSRLSRLVKKKRHEKDQDVSDRVKVRDVFDKGPSEDEIAEKKKALAASEQAVKEAKQRAKELDQREEQVREAEAAAKEAEKRGKELDRREKELEAAQQALREAEERERALRDREEQMAAREAELKEMAERLQQQETQQDRLEKEVSNKEETAEKSSAVHADDDIEARIASLETDLEMACPLCTSGSIKEAETEKGKTYYTCDNPDCRFISWAMPYHFQCPVCRNPYLIEFDTRNGETGLKCPRAACSFKQNSLGDPAVTMAQKASADAKAGTPRKKKKVVRRKKKR